MIYPSCSVAQVIRWPFEMAFSHLDTAVARAKKCYNENSWKGADISVIGASLSIALLESFPVINYLVCCVELAIRSFFFSAKIVPANRTAPADRTAPVSGKELLTGPSQQHIEELIQTNIEKPIGRIKEIKNVFLEQLDKQIVFFQVGGNKGLAFINAQRHFYSQFVPFAQDYLEKVVVNYEDINGASELKEAFFALKPHHKGGLTDEELILFLIDLKKKTVSFFDLLIDRIKVLTPDLRFDSFGLEETPLETVSDYLEYLGITSEKEASECLSIQIENLPSRGLVTLQDLLVLNLHRKINFIEEHYYLLIAACFVEKNKTVFYFDGFPACIDPIDLYDRFLASRKKLEKMIDEEELRADYGRTASLDAARDPKGKHRWHEDLKILKRMIDNEKKGVFDETEAHNLLTVAKHLPIRRLQGYLLKQDLLHFWSKGLGKTYGSGSLSRLQQDSPGTLDLLLNYL